jgi:hypothetical protein
VVLAFLRLAATIRAPPSPKSVLDADLPNLVQLDVSTLAGVLAERLLEHVPYLDKVFFANSGAETVEAAIKLPAARPDARVSSPVPTRFTDFPTARCR